MDELIKKFDEQAERLSIHVENMEKRITELEHVLKGLYIHNQKLVKEKKECKK